MTATATRKPRSKPRSKPERSATLGTTTSGKTILWLSQDGVLRAYVLTPLTSDFGTAYRLAKADNGDGHSEEYDVLLHGRETSCTCPGHTYCGKCKHVSALEALIAAGKLPAPNSEDKPQPAPKPEAKQPWCDVCNDNPDVYCPRCSL